MYPFCEVFPIGYLALGTIDIDIVLVMKHIYKSLCAYIVLMVSNMCCQKSSEYP